MCHCFLSKGWYQFLKDLILYKYLSNKHQKHQDQTSDQIEPHIQKDLDSGILKNSINSKFSIYELSKILIEIQTQMPNPIINSLPSTERKTLQVISILQASQLPNGTKYEGQWMYGIKNGFGKQIWPDGSNYEGQQKQDKSNGHVKLILMMIYMIVNGLKMLNVEKESILDEIELNMKMIG